MTLSCTVHYSVSTAIDLENLQSSRNCLAEWSRIWQLKISYMKCSHLYINGITNSHNVSMLLDKLATVDSVKDLGITVDSELKFGKHIGNIVAREHARANLIHKCFFSRDAQTLMRAFIVYVRPLLEYGSCVWSPHFKSDIDRIESVQCRFTKRSRFLNNMSYRRYSQRLMTLGLETLEVRRLHQDAFNV